MPLHLLGKKSWNVYNHDNIEKVKRDEAAAKAKEEAKEQRMQEIDAERRIQILRGEEPTPLPEIEDIPDDSGRKRRSDESGRERKRLRRGYGEDETDWQMRLAQEQSQSSNTERQVVLRKPSTADAPLLDPSGHIDLFPQEQKRVSVQKNEEAEKEKKKKEKELEDQYTMRFSNAAGFKQGLENPWYSKATSARDEAVEPVSKDVWGNEDPRRKEREAARIQSSDPLAAMRQGAAKVRQVERERKLWREEKEREMRELMEAEKSRKRMKRKYDEDEDDLEDFSLDRSERASPRHRDEHQDSRRHRHKETRRSSHRDEGHRHRHQDEERRHRQRHRHRDRD